MDSDQILEEFSKHKDKFNIPFQPKTEQLQVASSVLAGRNVLGLLPTGFGKTFCAIVPAIVNSESDPMTLVISPLTSLIDDQISKLEQWNFKCAKIESLTEMEQEVIAGISQGDFQFIFSSPESVLRPYWRNVFVSATWQTRLHLIAIDEAHCVSEWGDDFRKDYRLLSELRSIFKAPIMALTATTTEKVKSDIMEYLQLNDDDTDVVFRSCDRPNIFIQIEKRKSTDPDEYLDWLISHIKDKGVNSKKVIIYCRSIDAVSEIFLTFKSCLGHHAYAEGVIDAEHLLIEMFHKSTHPDSKTRILSEFKKTNSTIRCVVATVALGMGIDIADIDMVMHIGCPKSLLTYWQEAGRCARDGRSGLSVVLYDNFTLSLKNTSKDIADVVKSDQVCLRQQVVDTLTVGEKIAKDTSVCAGCENEKCDCASCKCCSVCIKRCPCQEKTHFDYVKFLTQ